MYKAIKKKVLPFLVTVLTVVIVGCGERPALDALDRDDLIVAFGDSLTEGVGARPENSYPSVLEKLSGIHVVNAGVSGEKTREGLARLPAVLDEHNPDLLILLEGGTQVVLIGVPEKRLFSDSAPFYSELAQKHDLVFAPALIGSLMRSPSKKSDSIHFNKAGYADMAEGIHNLLTDHGAF